jgi:hypothetical protein
MDDLQIIQDLNGTVCLCGKTKESGHSFCYGCYRRLPRPMGSHLYRRVGQGYEEAFEAAARQLKIWPEPQPEKLAA